MSDEPIDLEARIREIREKKARERGTFTPPPAPPEPSFHPDLIPDINQGVERSEEDVQMDGIIASITFPQAYNKWIGKMNAVQTKPDGNEISCPNPDHADPPKGNGHGGYNAWFKDDGTWYCGKCDEGGDIYDLAAIHYGYPIPGYKEGQLFHKLREQMAEDFGYRVKKVAGGKIIYREQESDSSDSDGPGGISTGNAGLDTGGTLEVGSPASPGTSSVPPPESQNPPLGTNSDTTGEPASSGQSVEPVAHLYADDDEAEIVLYPTIDWRAIVPENTFLRKYLEATTQDDSPEEYHFWHGLIALGHAVGRNVTLDDNRPVYGNMLLCLLGATGTGKSRSRGWLDRVIEGAMPYREDGLGTTGTKILAVPGSGEYLVSAFSYEGKDPTNSKVSLGYQPVNGIVDFDELAALLARANRQGSTLKPTIMGFADARDEVKIGSMTHGDYVARMPFCSITASTQPKAIRTLLNRTDTGSGFLNRWVFAGGPSKEREVIGGSHTSTVIDLADATEELKKIRGYGGITRSLTLEPDALNMLQTFYKKQVFPLQEKDQSDLLKRLDLLFKKLILLFAVNGRKMSVTSVEVSMAISLWEYVVECYGILNDNIGVTHSQEIAQEILRHVRRHTQKTGRGASARDIARYTARKNFSPEQIKKALEVMVALDWIELEKKAQGPGRPSVRYKAVGE